MLFEIKGLDKEQSKKFKKDLNIILGTYSGHITVNDSPSVTAPVTDSTTLNVKTSFGLLTAEVYHDAEYPGIHISFVDDESQNYVASVEVIEESRIPRVLVYTNLDEEEPSDIFNLDLEGSSKSVENNLINLRDGLHKFVVSTEKEYESNDVLPYMIILKAIVDGMTEDLKLD